MQGIQLVRYRLDGRPLSDLPISTAIPMETVRRVTPVVGKHLGNGGGRFHGLSDALVDTMRAEMGPKTIAILVGGQRANKTGWNFQTRQSGGHVERRAAQLGQGGWLSCRMNQVDECFTQRKDHRTTRT